MTQPAYKSVGPGAIRSALDAVHRMQPGSATTMTNTRSLSQLSAGQRATVVEITAAPALALHILEIGVVRGAAVRFLRAAPLGGPIEVEVDGFLLSLRRDEANSVLVDVSQNGSDPE